jgi:hypothetical protein
MTLSARELAKSGERGTRWFSAKLDPANCSREAMFGPMHVRRICLLLVVALLPSLMWARDAREQARIDFLIRGVETSSGVKFVRNGREYDGVAGANHLRTKLDYAGWRVKTAEDFVKYCASESSMTHQKYKIRLADGTTTDAATYFNAQLSEFDKKH